VPVEDIIKELNGFLRGWAGYFRYGNSARVLGQIRNYALRRVALLLSKKGKRRRSWDWGMRQVLASPSHLGLISHDEPSSRPGRSGTGAGRPNAVGEERR
jgi:Group II intron, maturase-specific domain